MLREADVALAQGMKVGEICRNIGISQLRDELLNWGIVPYACPATDDDTTHAYQTLLVRYLLHDLPRLCCWRLR
jgi:hypothetical protein